MVASIAGGHRNTASVSRCYLRDHQADQDTACCLFHCQTKLRETQNSPGNTKTPELVAGRDIWQSRFRNIASQQEQTAGFRSLGLKQSRSRDHAGQKVKNQQCPCFSYLASHLDGLTTKKRCWTARIGKPDFGALSAAENNNPGRGGRQVVNFAEVVEEVLAACPNVEICGLAGCSRSPEKGKVKWV